MGRDPRPEVLMLTETDLTALLGKHIHDICPQGYASDADNHCAHFVSHVLGYHYGATCGTMTVGGHGAAASIRVQELFPHCLMVGKWDDIPSPLWWGLVFITNPGNVDLKAKSLVNVPRKHVGIFIGGGRSIYHYSNRHHRVVTETPEQFSHHYAAPDNAMFWGAAP